MKSFFKIVAGSLIGFFIGLFLIGIIIMGIAGSAGKSKQVKVAPNSVLHLNLGVELPDQAEEAPFGGFDPFGMDLGPVVGLFELVEMIEHAKDDEKIKGIYLTCDYVNDGWASMDQLRRSLEDFKASGKFIIAYSNLSTQKAYYLNSVADEVHQHPSGMFEFDGLSIETMYYKKLLDKLEIEPIPLYAGDYKSASEPYRRSDMSEENREQLLILLEDFYDSFLSKISEARGVDKDELAAIANELLIENPQAALDKGLVDALNYEDQVFDAVRAKMGYDEDKAIEFIEMEDYGDSFEAPIPKGVSEKIAVVYAEGTISLGEGSIDNVGGEKFMKLIRKLRKDDKIKAIVLRVNSPGGVAYSSDKIWRELDLAQEAKPLVVSMGNYAASGGYYISAPADKIYAEENTVTGSIGVVGMLLNMEEFLENKIGLTFDRANIGQYADFGNLTREWSDREMEVAEHMVKSIYMDFKEKVSEGRDLTMEEVEELAQGRVYTGEDALELGLVDEIGGLEEALAHAAELANLEQYKLRTYPQEKDFYERIMEELMNTRSERLIKKQLGPLYQEVEAIREIGEWTGYQMRLPFEMEIK